jgi:hypothetical protein
VGIITADDLTVTVAATLQTIQFAALLPGDQILRVAWYLRVPFEVKGDASYAAQTVSIGDVAAVGTHLAAAEVNINGTEIIWRAGNTAVLYTAADKFAATFTAPAAGKSVSMLNKGELHVFTAVSRLKYVSDAVSASIISKP